MLEAILILDSCCLNFEPFSTSRAECLLPILAQRTLIDASLEFLLETNQFEHAVYLACHRHIDEIKKYINFIEGPHGTPMLLIISRLIT